MIYLAKFFSVVLGILVITKTYLDYRKKEENWLMFLFWTLTWLAIIYIALYPDSINNAIAKFGMSKTGTGTFFGMALVFLLFLIYRIYAKTNRIENQLRELIAKIGLKGLDKK